MEAVNLFKNVPMQAGDAKRASEMAKSIDTAGNAKKMKVAKDFESILVGQLMNQMKQTIGESGLLEDGSSKQVQDMFWSFLGEEVGSQGGLGLWKNVYESMSPDKGQADLKLDKSV
jgi:flagellar protein FlgJ